MAVLKFTNSKSSLKKLAQYITSDEKTEEILISGKDCMPASAYDEMITVKQMFGKRSGRQYIHLVQSFDIKDQVSYQKAHEVGREIAELFTGFQVLLATHKDRRHVHNHLLINSVNFETGLKFQQSKKDMEQIKGFSDELCKAAGLSVLERCKGMYISQAEYKVAEKGESWKWKLISTIEEAIKQAGTKDRFIQVMKLYGYEVIWTDRRKNITFITPEGFKCRDTKLHEKRYTKEELIDENRGQRNNRSAAISKEKTDNIKQGRRYAARDTAGVNSGYDRNAGRGRTDSAHDRCRKGNVVRRSRNIRTDKELNGFAERSNRKRKGIIHNDERGR